MIRESQTLSLAHPSLPYAAAHASCILLLAAVPCHCCGLALVAKGLIHNFLIPITLAPRPALISHPARLLLGPPRKLRRSYLNHRATQICGLSRRGRHDLNALPVKDVRKERQGKITWKFNDKLFGLH